MTVRGNTGIEYFDRMYEVPDPWGYETSWYEQRKYALTIASLPRPRYRRIFEPGCSIGVLTEHLAGRGDHVLAVDFHHASVERARRRLRHHTGVDVDTLDVPDGWPEGMFDLIVLSEVAYYLDDAHLELLADRVAASLEPGGDVVLVHWRGETDYPQTGDAVHDRWRADARFSTTASYRDDECNLDVVGLRPAPDDGDRGDADADADADGAVSGELAPVPAATWAGPTDTAHGTILRPALSGVVIVVPAHDEEELLPACLRSIRAALDHPGVRDLRSCIVVALDSCRDDSARLAARELRPTDRLVEVDHRNVGAARAIGTQVGIAAVGIDPGALWLAHTDADSLVPPHWLARQRALASATDAIAGVVRVGDWSEHDRRTRRAFGRSYRSSRLRPHPHVHGANLGVRASAYLDVGGFPAHVCSEDHALWDALRSAGHAHRSSRRVWVQTSARRVGRAHGGFADTLVGLPAQIRADRASSSVRNRSTQSRDSSSA